MKLFFSANSGRLHTQLRTPILSPFYVNPRTPVATLSGMGTFFAYNFAALTPAIPAADRQSFYGSFRRDICDKYLVLFADFKYTRSFFDSALAAAPFVPDPFRDSGRAFQLVLRACGCRSRMRLILLRWRTPFCRMARLLYTGVRFRAFNDTTVRTVEIHVQRCAVSMQDFAASWESFGNYFKNWNWEAGFRYSRDRCDTLLAGKVASAGRACAMLSWIRIRLRPLIRSWEPYRSQYRGGDRAGFMLPGTKRLPLSCAFRLFYC